MALPMPTESESRLVGAYLSRVKQTQSSIITPQLMPDSSQNLLVYLTLDQLIPNPLNPRKSRNPQFNEIRESIRKQGILNMFTVTRDPAIGDVYIIADGGNTRLACLRELWEETRDEKFYRLPCLIRPWAGQLRCLLGHLSENDVRGDLTFIERAKGILKARELYEQEGGVHLSLRELSEQLKRDGYRLDSSEIQRMEYSLKWLYPVFPCLFDAGMGRPQARNLIRLHRALTECIHNNPGVLGEGEDIQQMNALFSTIAARYDDPAVWSLESFEDELLLALSNASDYSPDWWKLVLKNGDSRNTPPLQLPDRKDEDGKEAVSPLVSAIPPAESSPHESAGTAPGTEIRTGGLSLTELANARAYDDDGSTSSKPVSPPAVDPRNTPDYSEEQLSLSGITSPGETGNDEDNHLANRDTQEHLPVIRQRIKLLRHASALAELAGMQDNVISDDSGTGCGFLITVNIGNSDTTGIQNFLQGLAFGEEIVPLPFSWLAENAHTPALTLATELILGAAQLHSLVREMSADTIVKEEVDQ